VLRELEAAHLADVAPQCVIEDTDEPMASADRESQRAFDSIEHIGLYSGGGMSEWCGRL
jgi:hypothetical protein